MPSALLSVVVPVSTPRRSSEPLLFSVYRPEPLEPPSMIPLVNLMAYMSKGQSPTRNSCDTEPSATRLVSPLGWLTLTIEVPSATCAALHPENTAPGGTDWFIRMSVESALKFVKTSCVPPATWTCPPATLVSVQELAS